MPIHSPATRSLQCILLLSAFMYQAVFINSEVIKFFAGSSSRQTLRTSVLM